jgi:16S rRNA (cytidine1402-2'-O)-methyltransferase
MLYLVPVPLAEGTASQVLPPQVAEVLRQTQVFWVENIRSARRFISQLKLGLVIDELHFEVLDKDTSIEVVRGWYQTHGSESIVVLSEAGCPGVADPGSVAVRLAHELGIGVVPLVGPSSILLALMASGFSGQSFVFHGYLPIEKQAKVQQIKQIEKEALAKNQTQIFMETPYRNNQLLDELLANCASQTRLHIAANITAPQQFLQTQTIQYWRKNKPDLHKIPVIFCIGK